MLARRPAEWRQRWRGKPQPQAQMMEQIHDRATQRPPSGTATVGLLAGWLVALVVAVAGVALTAGASWRPYTNDGARFAVEMPTQPGAPRRRDDWQIVAVQVRDDEYTVMWSELGNAAEWLTATADGLVATSQASIVTKTDTERRLTYTDHGSRVLMRLVVSGSRAYMVGAFTKTAHADGDRFVDSFRVLD